MARLIDTNVILRYLLRDNETMSDIAASIIQSSAFTIPEVIPEVVYVLNGVYSVERSILSETLTAFLDEIYVDDKPVLIFALELYASGSLDFVDCILAARSKIYGDDVFTFDKKLNKTLESMK